MAIEIPQRIEDLGLDTLNTLLREHHPDAVIESFHVLKAMQYGDGMVSTSARAFLELSYRADTGAGLPTRVIVKLAYDLEHLPWPLYTNEVKFYRELRKEVPVEAPVVLGAVYDHNSHRFLLVLEDLSERGASFPNALDNISVDKVAAALDELAALHARYWQSPRFDSDLATLETHVSGTLNDFMTRQVPHAIQHEIDINPYKRELVAKMGSSGDQLLKGMLAVQRHQASLPQTLLHGDSHVGNIYYLPDGSAGLLDWQLMVRGYCMHDVNYLITTALPIDLRRRHEQELLSHYLARLARYGVAQPPTFNDAFTEYRRTLIWGVYIGWLTTSVVNYGWEINTVNLLRLTTAYDDHDTTSLVAELL
ncbi:MAG: hypothetical protein VR73_13050 [Gammaproteobacteria bacterium BRH_c0]|nr:MAG: hypothetical protein VR73_13050 [Gammaproteobacteria bacterium BRH_c0]